MLDRNIMVLIYFFIYLVDQLGEIEEEEEMKSDDEDNANNTKEGEPFD